MRSLPLTVLRDSVVAPFLGNAIVALGSVCRANRFLYAACAALVDAAKRRIQWHAYSRAGRLRRRR